MPKDCKRSGITLIVAENGFIITPIERCGVQLNDANVCETFESLTKWLKENLKKPGEC